PKQEQSRSPVSCLDSVDPLPDTETPRPARRRPVTKYASLSTAFLRGDPPISALNWYTNLKRHIPCSSASLNYSVGRAGFRAFAQEASPRSAEQKTKRR